MWVTDVDPQRSAGPEPASDTGSETPSEADSNQESRPKPESDSGSGSEPTSEQSGLAGRIANADNEDDADLAIDEDLPQEADEDVEPVELLVQLAEEDKIEPWDINIVQVTDEFLAKLEAVDLRTTGRALFYASVLLRMKGDEMLSVEDDEPDAPAAEPWEMALSGEHTDEDDTRPAGDPVAALESEMDRRLDRKSTRGSPETLDQLVRELRDAEQSSWWKQSREYDTSGSPSGYDRGSQTVDYHAGDQFRRDGEPTEEDVTSNQHTEDIETVIADVQTALRSQFEAGRPEVLFAEIASTGGSPFMTFLALLFLADRGAVHLQQDDLFGDLWVQDPSAAVADTEAVAD